MSEKCGPHLGGFIFVTWATSKYTANLMIAIFRVLSLFVIKWPKIAIFRYFLVKNSVYK